MSKAAAVAVDWAQIQGKLGLGQQTLQALSSFRKRANDARVAYASVKDAKTTVDLDSYRSVLKNKGIVDEAQKILDTFKAVDYDVSAQVKAIDAFKAKAVASAGEASKAIAGELDTLQKTLNDIEGARPFDQLTLDEVAKARPEISQAVENAVKKGKWSVPGYQEKFGNLSVL